MDMETKKKEKEDGLCFNFEDYFNHEEISSDKIQFAKYYLDENLGADLEEDPMIIFSPISATVFGFLVAHIVDEYEKFKEKIDVANKGCNS